MTDIAMQSVAHELVPPAPSRGLENALVKLLSTLAGALVAAEILLLFCGVVARYGIGEPIIWADELATLLFVWLAMLGAALALARSAHMRMTTLVGKHRAFDFLALAIPLIFLADLLLPAIDYMFEEGDIDLPSLGISSIYRAGALPVGCGVMLLMAALRLHREFGAIRLVACLALAVVLGTSAPVLNPFISALGNINLLIFFVFGLGAAVLAGVPIAFCFGICALGYLSMATDAPPTLLVGGIEEGMSNIILLAVPLFIFLGMLLEMTGLGDAMVRFCITLLGHVRGGLYYVLIAAMYLVSGISGSKGADMAAVAPVLFPKMKQRGSAPGELAALLAATGAQTETIPPSLILITVGSVTGISIAALFSGGILPGLLLAFVLASLVAWRNRREDLTGITRASRSEIGRAFFVALPALVLPFVIRFAVVKGIATATEVSTIGIAYAALAGVLIYRRFDWRRIGPMLVDTASLSGAILLIIGCASAMGWGLVQSGFSQNLAQFMHELPGGAPMFMATSILAFVILGSILEGIPAIVLFGPLLFPIARSFGIGDVHYTMVVVLSLGLGLFSPPFGVGYYAACAIGRVDPSEGIKPLLGYMGVLLIGIIVIAAVPLLSTGLL